MMIEAIPREKAESISEYIPGLLSRILTASDNAEYLLISSDSVFTSFNIAIVEDGVISYISDESARRSAEDFLTQKKS